MVWRCGKWLLVLRLLLLSLLCASDPSPSPLSPSLPSPSPHHHPSSVVVDHQSSLSSSSSSSSSESLAGKTPDVDTLPHPASSHTSLTRKASSRGTSVTQQTRDSNVRNLQSSSISDNSGVGDLLDKTVVYRTRHRTDSVSKPQLQTESNNRQLNRVDKSLLKTDSSTQHDSNPSEETEHNTASVRDTSLKTTSKQHNTASVSDTSLKTRNKQHNTASVRDTSLKTTNKQHNTASVSDPPLKTESANTQRNTNSEPSPKTVSSSRRHITANKPPPNTVNTKHHSVSANQTLNTNTQQNTADKRSPNTEPSNTERGTVSASNLPKTSKTHLNTVDNPSLKSEASNTRRDVSESSTSKTSNTRRDSSASRPPKPSNTHQTSVRSHRPAPIRDKRVLRAVEKNLLGALGLASRPRPVGERSVPSYMLHLYRSQTAALAPHTAIHSPFLQVTGLAASHANTVRSFHHTEHHVTGGCEPGTCTRLLFNVSTIPATETLAAAELRIYVGRSHSDLDPESGVKGGRDKGRRGLERVEVHEIMQTVGEDGEEDCISRLLDTRVLEAGQRDPWLSFDIHPAVFKWKQGGSANKGLEIRLRLASTSPSDSKHVRLRRSSAMSEDTWREQRPLLVTYTDDGRGTNSKPAPSRSKRATNADRKRERRRKNRAGRTGRTSKRNRRNRKKKKKKKKRKRTKVGNKNMCRRHALYVDFSDVGWKDWIVAPDGYNAYYCQGDCNFPLAHHLNSTNHAIVQTLVNSVDPKAVPKVCCVPTELSAISMLYLDEWGKVVLKNYQDMVVEACGCL